MKFKNKILISILLILFLTIGVASAAEDFTSANSNVATVDNSTFFNYFDESGYLKESVSQNTLIFKGEFSNLNVEYIEINSPITLKGEEDVRATIEKNKKKPVKKSNFQKRLEEAQKQQAKMQAQQKR